MAEHSEEGGRSQWDRGVVAATQTLSKHATQCFINLLDYLPHVEGHAEEWSGKRRPVRNKTGSDWSRAPSITSKPAATSDIVLLVESVTFDVELLMSTPAKIVSGKKKKKKQQHILRW